jgi:hypothetical protein
MSNISKKPQYRLADLYSRILSTPSGSSTGPLDIYAGAELPRKKTKWAQVTKERDAGGWLEWIHESLPGEKKMADKKAKVINGNDLQVKWFPPGYPLNAIPNCLTGIEYKTKREVEIALEKYKKTYKDRLVNLDLIPAINWFNGETVTGIHGIWVFGWFEPEFNELGEVAP